MSHRAAASGIHLNRADAAIVKGMLARGDRQHDIAAWFGVNGGRVAEIATGEKFSYVEKAPAQSLPPCGPYMSGRDTAVLLLAIANARRALEGAEQLIRARAK